MSKIEIFSKNKQVQKLKKIKKMYYLKAQELAHGVQVTSGASSCNTRKMKVRYIISI